MNRFGDAPVEETAPSPEPETSAAPKPLTNRFGDVADQTQGNSPFVGSQPTDFAKYPSNPALQSQADQQAASQARGEISIREKGQELVPTRNADGTTTYTPTQVNPTTSLPLGQKAAITQAYQQQVAGRPQAQTPEQQDAQIQAATLQGNTAVQNFGGAVGQTFGNVRAGLMKTYDPEGGNRLAEDYQTTYSSDPNSNAALAGRVTAGVAMAPAVAAAPVAGSLVFGAQTFGDVRGEVAQRRAEGQQISQSDEFMAAGGQALMTFLASKVGAKYNEGVAKGLILQNAQLRREGASVVANTIKQYAFSAGVGLSDMEAMTLANNAIAKYTYAPDRNLGEGMNEAGVVGALSGPAGLAAHGGGASAVRAPEGAEAPLPSGITPEAAKAATPTPEQLAAVKTEPAVNNSPAAKSLLETSKQKFRIQDGANSRGVEVQFDDPTDRALYVATQPRKGKLQVEATKYLTDQGYKPDAIDNYGDEVRARLDEAAKGHTGDVLRLPKAGEVPAGTEGSVSEAPATVPGVGTGEGVQGQRGTVPPTEGVEATHLPSPEHEENAVSAAATEVRGFKRVAPQTRDHAEASKVFAKRGVKVVYFQGESQGFRMKKYPGVLFVNADKPVPSFREAIAHEFIHELHDKRPGLFENLRDAVGPAERAKWEQWYAEAFNKMRPGEKPTALGEEGVTTPIGKLASSNERVWTAAMGRDPSLLQKIGDFARPFLAKFSSKSRQIQAAVEAFKATLENPIQKPETVGPTRPKNTKVGGRYEINAADFLPSERVRKEAEDYTREAGIPHKPNSVVDSVNEPRARDIAKWYDEAKHNPSDPAVKASYDALKRESLAQYKFLESKGVKLEAWDKEGQPYQTSKDMLKDVQENKHLSFFTGGEMPKDHPLAEKAPGTPYTYNDVFRAVHDYFGHAKEGVGFGPKGEENAWRSHSAMFSTEARPAMTAETRGQNSWVNFGPKGEANRANPANTQYAEQKATVAPEHFVKTDEENGTTHLPEYPPKDYPESDYGYWVAPNGKAHAVRPYAHDEVAMGTLKAKDTTDALAKGYMRVVSQGDHETSIQISEDASPVHAKKLAAAAIANGRTVHVDVFGSGEEMTLKRMADLAKLDKIGAESPMTTHLPSDKEEREKALKSIETTDLRTSPLNSEKGMFGDILPRRASVKGEEVARILNERTKELAGQSKARESEKLARAVAAGIPEAEYQLQQPDSGKSWYKDDIAKMEKTMIERHPSLSDPSHMTIFKAILAITSQGNNPTINLKFADPIYSHWVDTGDIMKTQPSGKNWPGTLGENYKLPLGRLEKLIESKGIKDAAQWLLTKHSVAEVNAFSEGIGMNGNVSGPKDAQVYGMEMFGPKIGVFALNQHGIQEKVTKDMWFSRTWNRWMGTMLENGELVDAPRNDAERETMDKAVSILADKLGMEPSEVQAVLWYYEQQLWKAHGAKAESGSYSKAAEKVASGDEYDLARAQFESERQQAEKSGQGSADGGLYGSNGPGRSGGSQPDFLPGSKFYEDDVKPAFERAADGVRSAWEGVKSLIAPFTRTKDARTVANILREHGGELAQRHDRLEDAFGKARDLFDKMSVPASRKFIDDVENGRPTDPTLQPIADAVRAILDDRLHQVQALGAGKLVKFVTDYFPHLWEQPTKAAKVWQEAAAKAPLQGKKGFLKSRSLPTLADGLAKGLKPITENPIEAMMLRVREMDKFITAHQAFKEMEALGLLKKVKARDVAKYPGYAKIEDSIGTIFAKPSRRGAIQIQGYYMAPEAVANVINNYLSPGLRGHKFFGTAFRGFLGAGNLMNQAQLGLSFFHGAFVSFDSTISSFAIGLKNIGRGRVLTGAKQIGSALSIVTPIVSNYRTGGLIGKEWDHPGSTTPDIAAIVDAMKAAGGRKKMDDFYRTGWRDSLKKAWKAGNVVGSGLRLPMAAIEGMAVPLMEKFVPRVKRGVFFAMAQHELANLGPSPDRAALREAMGRAWDSVDNRMGQLVYDNLFWNKAVKDIAMASTRSVGWNLGTLREVAGGSADLTKAAYDLSLGRGKRSVDFTHKAAYAIALPAMTAYLGAIIHKLLTGDAPAELKDYFFPKTGEKDKDGHDVRLSLPSYMKDVFAYSKDPVQTLKNKTHPMVSTILEMLSNQDYYGTKIHNEDDPWMQQRIDDAKHLGKSFTPFGATEAVKLAQEGQGARSLLPLVGVTKARRDITNTPAELLASQLAGEEMPKGTRTHESVDRAALVRDLAAKVKAKAPGVADEFEAAMKTGKLVPSSVKQIEEHTRYTPFERTVQHLSVPNAMKVWDVATDDEKRAMAPFLIPHALRAENLKPEDKDVIIKKLARDWERLEKK